MLPPHGIWVSQDKKQCDYVTCLRLRTISFTRDKRVCFSVRWKHFLRISQFYSVVEVCTSLDRYSYGRVETESVWW